MAVNLFFVSAGTQQGDIILAVNTLLMTFFTIFSYISDGFAYAGEALSGKYYGAKNEQMFHRLHGLLIKWGFLFAGLFSLFYYLGGDLFLSLLTDKAEVISASHDYFLWAVFIPIAGIVAFIYDGIFIGLTETRGMLISSVISTCIFFITYLLLNPLLHNHALWLAMILYLLFRGIIQMFIINKKQKELNRKINDLIHQKNNSSIDLLINKKENTVDDSNNPLMNENLSEIMNEPSIYEYLKSNLNLFKTKFSRIIKTSEKNKINIQETILSACKTRGIPLELKYDKPKISKTNLVLVLDISGSCIGASKIMLSMMYYLKELFPGGVTTYVFVDKLYDVSDVMKSNNINEAFNIIQKTVPSINHWSNYYEPLKELWTKHSNKFRNDTFVLFIGDARNNRYESGEKYFKNIVSKSKRVWWLNTESQWYWNTGDSIAYIYNKYCKMFEVETLRDLIRFIERAK